MKRMKSILMWLVLCVFCAGVYAETYLEWEAASTVSGVAELQFFPVGGTIDRYQVVKVDDNLPLENIETENWEIPQRPIGGLCGTITIKPLAMEIAYPLTCTFIYSQVNKKSLLEPGSIARRNLVWGYPMELLNENTQIGQVAFTQDYSWTNNEQDNVHSISLLLPVDRGQHGHMRDNTFILSGRVELRDATGRILDRRLVIDCFWAAPSGTDMDRAWVMDEAEADRLLKDHAGITDCETVFSFPLNYLPYVEVAALWMSASEWEKHPLPVDFMRRLMLMGIWIYGYEDVIDELVQEVQLSAPGVVLLGGCEVPDEITILGQRRNRNYNVDRTLCETHYSSQTNQPLENNLPLFGTLRKSYTSWTLAVIIVYGLLCLIGLPTAFAKLKGSKRIVLWWSVPLGAMLVGIIGWTGGMLRLDHRPQVDLTEYRLAYAEWPDVYCSTVARLLTFNDDTAFWMLSPDTFYSEMLSNYDHVFHQKLISHSPAEIIYTVDHLQRGHMYNFEFMHFKQHVLPFEVHEEISDIVLQAHTNLQQVYLWRNDEFYIGGAVKAGESVTFNEKSKTSPIIWGLPTSLVAMFGASECTPSYCPPRNKRYRRNKPALTYDNPFENFWVVMALTEEMPEAQFLHEDAVTNGRVVWVVQIPKPLDGGDHGH